MRNRVCDMGKNITLEILSYLNFELTLKYLNYRNHIWELGIICSIFIEINEI